MCRHVQIYSNPALCFPSGVTAELLLAAGKRATNSQRTDSFGLKDYPRSQQRTRLSHHKRSRRDGNSQQIIRLACNCPEGKCDVASEPGILLSARLRNIASIHCSNATFHAAANVPRQTASRQETATKSVGKGRQLNRLPARSMPRGALRFMPFADSTT
jgi:hypothetical protein